MAIDLAVLTDKTLGRTPEREDVDMSANRIMEIEITPEQERILEQVAAGHGLSPAAFVRFLLFEVYANSRLAKLLGRVRVEGLTGLVPVAPGAYRREHDRGAER